VQTVRAEGRQGPSRSRKEHVRFTYGLLLRRSLRVLSHRVASLRRRIVLLVGVMVGLRRGSLWRVVAVAAGRNKVSPGYTTAFVSNFPFS